MRNIILLTAFIAVSFLLLGQKIVPINYDHRKLSEVTNSSETGYFYPVSDSIGFFNISKAKLVKVNYINGNLLEQFDENILISGIHKILDTNYKGIYTWYDEDVRNSLPYCQRQPFVYHCFSFLPKENFYAIDVKIVVGVEYDSGLDKFLHFLLFVDEDLNFQRLVKRDRIQGEYISERGDFFMSDSKEYYVNRTHRKVNEKNDFAHFSLEDNEYKFKGYIPGINSADKLNFFPARDISSIIVCGKRYVNNGSKLYVYDDIDDMSKYNVIDMKLGKNELIANLKLLENGDLVGLNIKVDETGVCRYATLFKTDAFFNKIDKLKTYDTRITALRSMEEKVFCSIHRDELN